MLYQNYPNPFNPETNIRFDLLQKAKIKITVYDVTGRETACLANRELPAGKYEINWNAGNYAAGVYFYRIETEDFVSAKKMILLK